MYQGHAPTWLSNWDQWLYLCNCSIPIGTNRTTCTWMHGMPMHPFPHMYTLICSCGQGFIQGCSLVGQERESICIWAPHFLHHVWFKTEKISSVCIPFRSIYLWAVPHQNWNFYCRGCLKFYFDWANHTSRTCHFWRHFVYQWCTECLRFVILHWILQNYSGSKLKRIFFFL